MKSALFILGVLLLVVTNASATQCSPSLTDNLIAAKATTDQIKGLCGAANASYDESSITSLLKANATPEQIMAWLTAQLSPAQALLAAQLTPGQTKTLQGGSQQNSLCNTRASDVSVCWDIGTTAGITIFKSAKTGTYDFTNVSPELRMRFKLDNYLGWGWVKNSDFFLGLGTPLVSSINQNTTNTQSSNPTSIWKSDIYIGAGIMANKPFNFPASKLDFMPVFEFGWMSQQVDKTNGVFDKGGFISFGITTNLVSF